MAKKVIISVLKYPNYEMAFIEVDKKVVFSGNYWDFHSGCRGTKIWNYDLAGVWDMGINSLVTALKTMAEKDGMTVLIEHKDLTKTEYNEMMGN